MSAPQGASFWLNPGVCLPDHSSAVLGHPEALLEDTGIWEGVGGTSQFSQGIHHSFYVKILILRLLKWTKKWDWTFNIVMVTLLKVCFGVLDCIFIILGKQIW